MPDLKKAELVEISAGNNPQPMGKPDLVQFNPTTLRVQISNQTAGGHQAGSQARQRPGTGEMTVSFDLVFDTADEGGDVLRKTAIVERYVRPRGNAPGQEAPPRVQFTWGSFQVQGTMESANLDIDLFDAGGTPLRAKVAVSIKGQDPRWTYQPVAPATPAPGRAGLPVNAAALPAGAPGSQGSSRAADKVVQAMPGESLPQLAARFGLDPGAWRALADGLTDPLNLSLGQEVSLPASLVLGSAGSTSAQGRDPARTTGSLGLVGAEVGAGAGSASSGGGGIANAARRAPQQGGLALTARGGVGAAIDSTHAQAHSTSADASLAAFGLGAADTGDAAGRPWGAGVPLCPRFGSGVPAARRDPTQPGWIAGAPAAPAASTRAAARPVTPAKTGPKRGCGCDKSR